MSGTICTLPAVVLCVFRREALLSGEMFEKSRMRSTMVAMCGCVRAVVGETVEALGVISTGKLHEAA